MDTSIHWLITTYWNISNLGCHLEITELINRVISIHVLLQMGIIVPPDLPPNPSVYQPNQDKLDTIPTIDPIIFEPYKPQRPSYISLLEKLISKIFPSFEREAVDPSAGQMDDDDIFQYRILETKDVSKTISQLEKLYKGYPIPYNNDPWNEFVVFLQQLLTEIAETLFDPKKLAPILTDALIITPTAGLGFAIGRYITNRIKAWSRSKKNRFGTGVADNLQQIQDYFVKVPRSRLAEIVVGTKLPEPKVKALLRLGPFTHEKNCFWRFAEELELTKTEGGVTNKQHKHSITDQVSKNKQTYLIRYYDFKKKYAKYPLVEGTSLSSENWKVWETRALELIKSDLKPGWKVDTSAWDSTCIIYERKRINLLRKGSIPAWILYLVISLFTSGLGLFIVPFFMYRDFIELKGIEALLIRTQ